MTNVITLTEAEMSQAVANWVAKRIPPSTAKQLKCVVTFAADRKWSGKGKFSATVEVLDERGD